MSENIEVITSNHGHIMLINDLKTLKMYSRVYISKWHYRRCYEKKSAKMFTKNNYVLVTFDENHTAEYYRAVDKRVIDRQIMNFACKRKAVKDINLYEAQKIILLEI